MLSLVRLDKTQDRAAIVRLLSMSHVPLANSTGGQSLVEILPLLLGVGAVAAVGTVGILGAAGVFNSHKNRRRAHDSNPPCESTDPLDTNDQDCSVYRWNSIVNYYPFHDNLVRMDKKVVEGEDEVGALMSAILGKEEVNFDQLFGRDGTVSKPSATDGLIREEAIVAAAAAQLQGVGIAATDASYAKLGEVAQNAIDDSKAIKENIAGAFSRLMDQFNEMAKRQAVSQTANSDRMNRAATGALKASVSDVLTAQKAVSGTLQTVKSTGDKSMNQFASTSTKLQTALNDASSEIDATNSSLEALNTGVTSSIERLVSQAVDPIVKTGKETASSVASQVDKIRSQLEMATRSTINSSQASWKNVSSNAILSQQALADAVGINMEEVLVKNTSDFLQSYTANLTDQISSTQDGIAGNSKDGQSVLSEVSTATGLLSNGLSTSVADIASDAAKVKSDIQTSVKTTERQADPILSNGGEAVSAGLQSLLSALSAAGADASSSLQMTENEYSDVISRVLQSVGSDGVGVSNELGEVAGLVRNGKVRTVADLEAQLKSVLADANADGSRLMNAGDKLVAQFDPLQAGNALADAIDEIGAALADGGREVTRVAASGLQNDNALALPSVRESVLSQFGAAVDKHGELNTASVSLVDSMRGVDSGITTATGTLDKLRQADADGIRTLGSALADADDDMTDTVEKQLASVSNMGPVNSRDVNAAVNAGRKSLDQRKAVLDELSDNGETLQEKMLDTADGLLAQGKELQQQLDGRVDSSESGQETLADSLKSKLAEIGVADINSGSLLSASALAGLSQDSLNRVHSFLRDYVAAQQKNVLERNDGGDRSAAAMEGAVGQLSTDTVSIKGHVAVLDADGKASGVLDESVATLLTGAHDGIASFQSATESLTSELRAMKAATGSALQNITATTRSAILAVPQSISSGALALERDFRLASSDLSTQILKTREKLATASSEEERTAAAQGLVVLTKLQAVQQGVLDADNALRGRLELGQQVSLGESEGVQSAMGSVLTGMVGLDAQFDSTAQSGQADIETVGKGTASIVNGYGVLVNGSTERLNGEAAQSALLQAIQFNDAQRRAYSEDRRTQLGTQRAGASATNHTNVSQGHMDESSRLLRDLRTGATDSATSISEMTARVLSDLSTRSGMIVTNSSDSQQDVVTRLGLVRMAMASFLAVWNEYAVAMDRVVHTMVKDEQSTIVQMETHVRADLMKTEQRFNATNNDLSVLIRLMGVSDQDQLEFEDEFDRTTRAIRGQTSSINDGSEAAVIGLHRTLDAAMNANTNGASDTLTQIEGMLDNFASHGGAY